MRVFGLLLATVLVAVPATAQALYPTGTVEVTAGPVDCDGEECYDITVRCSNVAAPAKARLKVGGAAEKGTILFTTGGPGTFQYGGFFQSRKILYNTRAARRARSEARAAGAARRPRRACRRVSRA